MTQPTANLTLSLARSGGAALGLSLSTGPSMVPGVGSSAGTSTAAGGGAARWAAAGLAGGTSTAAGVGRAVPAGMVARWTLDDTSAGYVDLVGGRVLTAGGTGVGTAAGIIGNAASFGGAGSLETPDAPALRLADGFAIELWARVTTPATYQMFASKGRSQPEYALALLGGKLFGFMYDTTLTQAVFPEGTTVVTADTWFHAVMAVDGNRIRLYLNGVLEATSAVLSGTYGGRSNALFLAANVNDQFLTGRLDEPGVWQFGASGAPGAAYWLARYNSGAGVRL